MDKLKIEVLNTKSKDAYDFFSEIFLKRARKYFVDFLLFSLGV